MNEIKLIIFLLICFCFVTFFLYLNEKIPFNKYLTPIAYIIIIFISSFISFVIEKIYYPYSHPIKGFVGFSLSFLIIFILSFIGLIFSVYNTKNNSGDCVKDVINKVDDLCYKKCRKLNCSTEYCNNSDGECNCNRHNIIDEYLEECPEEQVKKYNYYSDQQIPYFTYSVISFIIGIATNFILLK